MKLMLLLVCIAAFAFASDDGCTSISHGTQPPASDAISFTVINDYVLSGKTLGIDVFENGSAVYVLGTDNTSGYIQAWDAATGAALGTLPLDPANASIFGVAWNNDPDTDTYYTNDWQDTVLYYTEDFGVSWTTVANPAGSSSRGMDFDGTDYWTTNADGGGLWRFQPGVGAENISIPEVTTQPSGVGVFPYMGDVGVAVTTYNNLNIWVYVWDGSTLEYQGSAACPVSCTKSYGLAYSDYTGHLYWSFQPSGGGYAIAELDLAISSLDRDTWAGIKTSF